MKTLKLICDSRGFDYDLISRAWKSRKDGIIWENGFCIIVRSKAHGNYLMVETANEQYTFSDIRKITKFCRAVKYQFCILFESNFDVVARMAKIIGFVPMENNRGAIWYG